MEKRIDLQSMRLAHPVSTAPYNGSLTKVQKSCAELYALKSIDIVDVCDLLECEEKDLPKEFFTYAEEYGKEYDDWYQSRIELHYEWEGR